MGHRDACSKGKDGSMHFYKEGAFYDGHGIVGAQVPHSCGFVAFPQGYSKDITMSLLLKPTN
ncbi:Dehydrogenase, E1 component [Sesbania bispinosa]|nr:Dehydrogenase, E1 component [Sesbania bispinosa]